MLVGVLPAQMFVHHCVPNLLELELQQAVSCYMVLEIKPVYSRRAVSTLHPITG